MKRNLFIAMACLVGIASFAQKKGDMLVSGSFTADFGVYKASSSIRENSTSEFSPFNSEYSIDAGYGYFVADNVRVGAYLSVPYYSYPTVKDGDKWLKDKVISVDVTPHVAYYLKLADKFYYTPEVGAVLSWGRSTMQWEPSETTVVPTTAWGIYMDLFAVEYKVTDKIALGASLGGPSYFRVTEKYGAESVKTDQFLFDFSGATLSFNYYF